MGRGAMVKALRDDTAAAACPQPFIVLMGWSPEIAEAAAATGADAIGVAGEIIRQPKLAATYARIAQEGKESFYRGSLAKEIVESIQAQGGILDADDLA